jgi:hypothetical protein
VRETHIPGKYCLTGNYKWIFRSTRSLVWLPQHSQWPATRKSFRWIKSSRRRWGLESGKDDRPTVSPLLSSRINVYSFVDARRG